MEVLVINCGSSSLKFQLINSDNEKVLAKGLCERIGISGSAITYESVNCEKILTASLQKERVGHQILVTDLNVR